MHIGTYINIYIRTYQVWNQKHKNNYSCFKVIIYSFVWRLKIEKHVVSHKNSSGKSVSKLYHNTIKLLYYLHCSTSVLSRLDDRYSQAIWFQRDFLKLRWALPTFSVKVIMQTTVVTDINFYFYIVEYFGLHIILYAWEFCARRDGGVAARNAFYTSSPWQKTRVRLVHMTRILDAFECKTIRNPIQTNHYIHVGTTRFLDSLGAAVARQFKSPTRLYFIVIYLAPHTKYTICSHDGRASKVVKVFGPVHWDADRRVINLNESGGGGYGDGFTTRFRANPRAGTIFIVI